MSRSQNACAFEDASPLAQTLATLFDALVYYADGPDPERAQKALATYGHSDRGTHLLRKDARERQHPRAISHE